MTKNINATPIMSLICMVIFAANALKAQDINATNMSPIGSEAFEVMRQFYDYDQAVPLDARIIEQVDLPGYIREKIIFYGQRNTVPGYLATPKNGSAPYPIILLLHGITSSKESWWEEHSTMWQLTENLLASGYAVLTLDAEYHGERSGNNPFNSPIDLLENEWFVRLRDVMIQSVIDYRRAMDYLAMRADIDASRIGTVGYSMGGIMTFILSAVDTRIGAAVSCVSPIVTVPYLPTAVQNFAPFIEQTPFLMLMGKTDDRNYTVESAEQLCRLIGNHTKDLIFFDSGHMLPPAWTDYAKKWIYNHLK